MADEETIEVKEISVPEGTPDLFDIGDPVEAVAAEGEAALEREAAREAPETPALETPAPEPEKTGLPTWLAELPEADRRTVITDALASMSPDERAQLEPVRDLLSQTQVQTADAVVRQNRESQDEDARIAAIMQTAESFKSRVGAYLGEDSGLDIDAETGNLVEAAQTDYHSSMVHDIETSALGPALARVGVDASQLPSNVVQAINGAQSFGQVLNIYMSYAEDVAYSLGSQKEKGSQTRKSDAEAIADKARTRNEVLGELAKEGRIVIENGIATSADKTPPVISGSPAAPGGALDDATFTRIMNDSEAYDEFIKDPARKKQLDQLMSGALVGV